jgi:hypothetical protein
MCPRGIRSISASFRRFGELLLRKLTTGEALWLRRSESVSAPPTANSNRTKPAIVTERDTRLRRWLH